MHGGIENFVNVKIKWINSEKLKKHKLISSLKDCDGILVPGGFGVKRY